MIYTKDKRSYVKPELEAVWMDNEALLDGGPMGSALHQPADDSKEPWCAKRNIVRTNQWDDWEDEEEEDDGWVY